jgi:phage tail sheath gpL-like
MAISFLQVPVGVKVPGNYVEFDTSKAIQGLSIQPYNVLLIGQRLSDGTKPAGQIDKVTSAAQARKFYGKGSMLYHMAETFISENQGLNELNCISLADDGSAVAATGSYEFTAPATGDGTLSVMLGGRRYRIAVTSGDTEAEMATALVAEIQADEDRLVDSAVDGSNADLVNFTARNAGVVGNDLDIRENYFDDEELPAGVATTITAMSGGSANPDIAGVITAMGEQEYKVIVMPYSDSANLLLMQTELQDRWGPIRQNDGHLFICRKEDFADHSTFLGTRNNEQETVMNISGPTPSFMWASNIGAAVAQEGQRDPARPLQTVALSQVLAPKDSELFNFGERDQLLKAGSSTYFVDGSNIVRIERLRTTRIENEFGALDEAIADLNPKLTLSYLRFDYRTMLTLKFPRHKLADDGTRFGPGQAIVTPKILKAEAIARFRQWEEIGLVEGADQFKRDLIIERSATDVNRADHLLSPDLMNQLRVNGVQIGYLL